MTDAKHDWNAIVEELGPPLFRFFCASFDAARASDLVQDTLVRLVQKCRSGAFDGTRSSLKSFAFGIARYVRLEMLKTTARVPLGNHEELAEIPASTPPADASDRLTHLRWAIGQLSLVEQEVMALSLDDDFGLEQISIELDLPLGTVKSHMFRARQKLRTLMENDL